MRRPDEPSSRLRTRLRDWYRRNRRDLPWRRTRDPYAIWVSEVMLQQTRVEVVIPYYRRFLALFPDAASLARASPEAVLAAWSGLGYYRRARALRAGARALVQEHGGRLPAQREELERLPGIGRYTAGAIASIAFGRPEPALDGNVRRVLCRLHAIDGRSGGTRLWELAAGWARSRDPAGTNQALMELGALVCTPRTPRCGSCPLRARCRARIEGRPERYPAPPRRRATESVTVAVAWISRAGRTLLERPAHGNPLRGTWDFPATEPGRDDPCTALAAHLRRRGLDVAVGESLATLPHAILHRRLRLDVFACRLRRGRAARSRNLRWVDPASLDGTPVSGATRKIASALAGGGPDAERGPRAGGAAGRAARRRGPRHRRLHPA